MADDARGKATPERSTESDVEVDPQEAFIRRVTDGILTSYDEVGGVNCPHGVNLPSRTAVIDILHQAEALCFPGYHRDEDLTTAKLGYVTGHKVAELHDALTDQLRKDFCAAAFSVATDAEKSSCGRKLTRERFDAIDAQALAATRNFLEKIPSIRSAMALDVDAILEGDPAAQSKDEVILSYPGLRAILVHRIGHHFWNGGARLVARMMHEYVHSKTGIDIHPGATIGPYFCIDHGTGVVVGETCVIGERVKLYQGVTLGALSVKRSLAGTKRHPTLEDRVTIYAGATILGGDTVVGSHTVVGGNTWLVKSVPPYSIVESDPLVRVRAKGTNTNDPWHWEI